MKLSAWARENGYTYTGAWLKFKRGDLPNSFQTPDGSIIVESKPKVKINCCAVYCRVSSNQQAKTNLIYQRDRLCAFAQARGLPVKYTVTEVGSGLNDKRPKLLRLLKRDDFNDLIVEHKDRLARFGVEYIKLIGEIKGVTLLMVNDVCTDKEDIIQDFVSLVTSFCARLYGNRRTKRSTERLIQELSQHENRATSDKT